MERVSGWGKEMIYGCCNCTTEYKAFGWLPGGANSFDSKARSFQDVAAVTKARKTAVCTLRESNIAATEQWSHEQLQGFDWCEQAAIEVAQEDMQYWD